MSNPYFWSSVAVLVFACAITAEASAESLWVDELHTAWVLFGEEGSWTERAAGGNQTPFYFGLLQGFSQTLGWFWRWLAWPSLEFTLRLPSIASWIAAILVVGKYCHSRDRALWVFPMLWIAVDRIQWFYATEARPYAILELVLLVGWCIVNGLRTGDESTSIDTKSVSTWKIIAWTVTASMAIHLHLTAGLPIILQWMVGGWMLRHRAMPLWMMAGSIVLLTGLPLMQLAWPVWQRRDMWESFASDVSLANSLGLFPFLAMLIPTTVAYFFDRITQPSRSAWSIDRHDRSAMIMWGLAAFGPILISWFITAIGIAPIYHRRFLIGSALPLVIIAFLQLAKIRNKGLGIAAAITVTLAIIVSQGTFDLWRHGVFVGKLRNENWRSAATWIAERIQPTDIIFCSSGLIEADRELPLTDPVSQYLSFPLRSIYRVSDQEHREIEVIGLVRDENLWHLQMSAALKDQTQSWIVYRGALQRFEAKLNTVQVYAKDNFLPFSFGPVQRFGNVFVVQVSKSS